MGQGAAGRKPSGMLMVNGTLYMWIRNWNYDGTTSRDSKLAYSTDHGAHWSTGSFTLPFGYPTFLNFGKNYAGARDGYVYIYSHDDPSAYVAADRFVLMRVPSDRLTDRTQYQFFVSRDANGNATWSNDIAQRGAVFTHAGHALRSGITYDAGIGRYLWWQMYPVTGEDNRFTGGFGVYDAPTPWGPWTTVYFTTDWGIGPGETASFPTKWMSTDGRTVNLVFSGNDRFSVRQATLTVAGGNQGTFNWSTGTPESQGMSTAALDSAWQGLQSHHTTAFVVIRHDTIAYQRYATNWSFTRPHYTASSAKALVAGMSAAVAISDHRLSLEDYANQYVPTWTNVTNKRDIKLKHLGSHSSGIDDAEEFDANGDPIPHEQLTGWKGAFWDRPAVPNDLFHISRDQAPTLFAPGTRFSYSNPGIAMLAWCITKALVTTHAPQTNLRSLLTARVMQPIGVPASEWNIGYAGTWNVNDGVDTLALVPAHGGANYSPNAMARVARLVREGGNWQGSQLIDSAAVTQTTSNAGINGHGIGWWTNSQHVWSSSLPADAYFGMGSGHQIVLVIPSLDLIVIRQGETLDPVGYPPHADPTGNRAADHYLYAPVMNAITP
jgi:CubicO group peptidase (beta-lactamase class C family)